MRITLPTSHHVSDVRKICVRIEVFRDEFEDQPCETGSAPRSRVSPYN